MFLACGHALTLNMRVISVYLGQYHGCWCPGSLRRQDISSHDIDYIEYVGPSLTWRSVLSTCVKSMWRNDIKCKYMFMFPQKKLARKGLISSPEVSCWVSVLSILRVECLDTGQHCNMQISYTLSHEYWLVRNRYSRLLFTNEDRLCANLPVQEKSTNMTWQCQCLAFTWRHRSTVMTSQY